MKEKILKFLPFVLMVLIAIVVINAILTFAPASVKAWVTDPVGGIKNLLAKKPASSAAA